MTSSPLPRHPIPDTRYPASLLPDDCRHVALGASLYVPATRPDLAEIANGDRLPGIRSLIFCTEDAVRPDMLEAALRGLESALPLMRPVAGRLRFIRVRNPHVLGRLLEADGVANLDGFVIPKATRRNLPAYLQLLTARDPYLLMPTLETADVFDPAEMRALRDELLADDAARRRVLALRIGGNDLLNLLGGRRNCRRTLYETPLGPLVSMLAGIFRPAGFPLTAPVFEGLAHAAVLREEVERDLEHGLFGKTAVHPDQVGDIEAGYRVAPVDLEMALRLLAEDSPAVFRMHDTMCEGTTHARWARQIAARAQVYGVADAAPDADVAVHSFAVPPPPAHRLARPAAVIPAPETRP